MPKTAGSSEFKTKVRLKDIRIYGYRACVRTHFVPQRNLSCLIGYNGSGKTSVLTAIRLLGSVFAVGGGPFFRDEPPTGTCRLDVEFEYKEKPILLRLDVVFRASTSIHDEVVNYRAHWNFKSISKQTKWISIPFGALYQPELFHMDLHPRSRRELMYRIGWSSDVNLSPRMYEAVNAISEYMRHITYYGASQFTNPSRCPPSFEVEEEKGRGGTSRRGHHAKFISDLYFAYARREQTTDYAQFLDLVGPRGLHLIDRFNFRAYALPESRLKVSTGGKVTRQIVRRNLVVPNVFYERTQLSPSQLSEGTFKTLALVFYLVSDRSALLLVEEPEVCVHHGLLNSIVQLIKLYSRRKQIIFSTHSDFVLDALAPENVFLVDRTRSRGTTVRAVPDALSKSDFAALREYLAESGNLGEFWKHGGFAKVD